MNDTPVEAEVKEKLVLKDEEEKKDNPEEEKIEEGKAVNATKKEADVPDVTALLSQLQSTLDISTKEAQSLRGEIQVQVKEINDLKSLAEQGFVKTKEILDTQAAVITTLSERLATAELKVKELNGEVPSGARQAYHPSQALQNVISNMSNSPIAATIKETREQLQQQADVNPINAFLSKANAGIGLTQNTNSLPQ